MVITGAVYFWTTRFHDGVSIFVVGLVSTFVYLSLNVCDCNGCVCVVCSASTGQLWDDVGRGAVFTMARLRRLHLMCASPIIENVGGHHRT